jgi:hypothetical protein
MIHTEILLKKALVKDAVEALRKEIEDTFKGKTVFFEKDGPCAVESVFIYNDASEAEWTTGDLWVTFLPEKEEDDDMMVFCPIDDLDKLKILV